MVHGQRCGKPPFPNPNPNPPVITSGTDMVRRCTPSSRGVCVLKLGTKVTKGPTRRNRREWYMDKGAASLPSLTLIQALRRW